MTWAAEEFAGAALGDARLTHRLIKLAGHFAAKPTASIPGACPDWSETHAVYRFFEQANHPTRPMGWQDILQPHMDRTEARMAQHPVALCLQDTTELNFNGQDINGLGPPFYEAQRGMYVHPTFVVTPQREPLGVTDAWIWWREFKGPDGKRPGELESQRWSEGYARVAEMAATLPQTRLVYVADREADILELMQRAHRLVHPADWLIRAQHNRCLPEGGKLWPTVLAGESLGLIEFTMPARPGQTARVVRQQVFVQRVSLPDGEGGQMHVTCLIAKEIDAPAGVKPVEWRLLTNRLVEDFEAAVELIDWYRCRWEIETFFLVLKNGCRLEALLLHTQGKLELALAVYLVVAWRLLRLIKMGRTQPDMAAATLFSEAEWQGAYALRKKPMPKTPPTLREVIRQIAMLGGFLGRKHDGEPGVKTFWLGFQRIHDFVAGIEHLRQSL